MSVLSLITTASALSYGESKKKIWPKEQQQYNLIKNQNIPTRQQKD